MYNACGGASFFGSAMADSVELLLGAHAPTFRLVNEELGAHSGGLAQFGRGIVGSLVCGSFDHFDTATRQHTYFDTLIESRLHNYSPKDCTGRWH